jgi:hypothetical protein
VTPPVPAPGEPGAPRHSDRTKPFTPAGGEMHLEEITAHVARHLGPVANVFHEIVSDLVHIDVLIVEPTETRPWYWLVTSGMSDLPMNVPPGQAGSAHAELVIAVASRVSLTDATMADERVYWPIRHLKRMARMPHALDTWLAPGQTVAADPPEPVAPGVAFCAFAVLELLAEDARRLRCADGKDIAFLQLVPLYREELEWKLAQATPDTMAVLFDTDALRLALEGRPNLKDRAVTALVDAQVARIERGGRIVLAIAIVTVALAIADFVAAWADGGRVRWMRVLWTIWLGLYLGQGARWARWVTVVLMTLGGAGGVVLGMEPGLGKWQHTVLLVAAPLWLVMAAILVFPGSVRLWFAMHASRRKT